MIYDSKKNRNNLCNNIDVLRGRGVCIYSFFLKKKSGVIYIIILMFSVSKCFLKIKIIYVNKLYVG